MMKGSALALAALVLGAGCIVKDEPVVDASAAEAPTATPPTEPPDGRQGLAAFNETNRTEAGAMGAHHRHDYWQGRERVTLLDGEAALARALDPRAPAWTRILLPEGGLVYEGAGSVEVTLSDPERRACTIVYDPSRVCSDRAAPLPTAMPVTGVRLLYQDAAAAEPTDLGEVKWGTPFVIPITDPKQTDMPHAQTSLWTFWVRSSDGALDGAKFKVLVEVVRAPGEDVPLWPGHPDLYAESPTRVVLQASATTRENGPMVLVDRTGQQRQYVAPEKLVSYGTRTLYVYANITGFRSENPALTPSEWVLAWHNATLRARAVGGEGHEGTVKEHLFVLPVDDAGMDSPYAAKSRWGFLLFGYFMAGAPGVPVLGCSGLCATYEVSYDLTVIASSEALPAEAYDVEPS